MSTYLRNHKDGNTDAVINVVGDNWDLDYQLDALLMWLKDHPNFNFANGEWIVDIGFEPRGSADVAGYTIKLELMRLLSLNGITLWLSDYLNRKDA